MKEFEFVATVTEEDIKRLRQKRQTTRGVLTLVLIAALVWVCSGLELSPGTIEFGTLELGSGTKQQNVTLTNRNITEVRAMRIAVEGESRNEFRLLDATSCSKLIA